MVPKTGILEDGSGVHKEEGEVSRQRTEMVQKVMASQRRDCWKLSGVQGLYRWQTPIDSKGWQGNFEAVLIF